MSSKSPSCDYLPFTKGLLLMENSSFLNSNDFFTCVLDLATVYSSSDASPLPLEVHVAAKLSYN